MSRSSYLATALITSVTSLFAAARPLTAQTRAESGAFITRLGSDTIAVERYSRSATRLEGEQVVRTPRTALRRYAVDFDAGGSATLIEYTIQRPGGAPDAPPIQRVTATRVGDSLRIETRRGDSTRAQTLAVPTGAVPLFGNAWGAYEVLVGRWRVTRADSAVVTAYNVGAPRTDQVLVRRVARDSLHLTLSTGTFHARIDGAGRIVRYDGIGTTQQFQVERRPSADVGALAAEFAARDAQGQAVGQLSPRDTVRATIAGASLLVDYGRPHKRGRVIFGDVVPWDVVWRTGANAATQMRTDRDLVIGGATVPAGTYTLWTLPSPSGWKLIVNRQTGQWGTEYNAAQDLARIDLQTETLAAPVEVFTITIEASGQGGALRLAWDATRAWIPFTVR